ncbi:nuclear transport factor 2 family protein [Actinosynnema sp. NPDC050801]|uniref:nuclear transport factor 2 family protein n=1 Tax=unclassified Actinosynnema TaxID=2637065 RepID=UPI0033FFAF4D
MVEDQSAGELLTIARKFFDSMTGQDWAAVRSMATDDIVWTMPGTSRISGTVVGKEALIERVRRVAAAGVTMRKIELVHMLVGRTGVTMFMHNSAQAEDGRKLEEHLASVYAIQNGKVTGIDTFVTDLKGVNDFFIK